MSGGYFDSGWQGDGETCGVCGRVMTDGPCACAAKPPRIELHIKAKVCQCSGCGRVRIGKDWVRDDSVQVDVTGFCATCGDRAHRKHIRDEKAWMRRLREPAEPPREMTDEDWDAFK